jgi:hypothetical protein
LASVGGVMGPPAPVGGKTPAAFKTPAPPVSEQVSCSRNSAGSASRGAAVYMRALALLFGCRCYMKARGCQQNLVSWLKQTEHTYNQCELVRKQTTNEYMLVAAASLAGKAQR